MINNLQSESGRVCTLFKCSISFEKVKSSAETVKKAEKRNCDELKNNEESLCSYSCSEYLHNLQGTRSAAEGGLRWRYVPVHGYDTSQLQAACGCTWEVPRQSCRLGFGQQRLGDPVVALWWCWFLHNTNGQEVDCLTQKCHSELLEFDTQ